MRKKIVQENTMVYLPQLDLDNIQCNTINKIHIFLCCSLSRDDHYNKIKKKDSTNTHTQKRPILRKFSIATFMSERKLFSSI